jgi:3-oxoacyl-[acyl-carrier-protein] synthase III
VSEIDHIIFTQVNVNSIKLVMENLGLPIEKAHYVMDKWGYMGSACLPIAFHDAVKWARSLPYARSLLRIWCRLQPGSYLFYHALMEAGL